MSGKLDDARNVIQQKIVKALREYRNLHSVQHRLGSRLIYPESLKFLPLYGLAICKSTPLQGGPADASLDERCAAGFTMMALPVKKLLKLLYPSLFRVDEWLLKVCASLCQLALSNIFFSIKFLKSFFEFTCCSHQQTLMTLRTY